MHEITIAYLASGYKPLCNDDIEWDGPYRGKHTSCKICRNQPICEIVNKNHETDALFGQEI